MYGEPLSLIFRALIFLLEDSVHEDMPEDEIQKRRSLIEKLKKCC